MSVEIHTPRATVGQAIRSYLRAHPRVAVALVLAAIQLVSMLAHRASPRAGRAVDAVAPMALPALVAALTDDVPHTVEPVTIIGTGGAPSAGGAP